MLRWFLLCSWVFLGYVVAQALLSHQPAAPGLATELRAMYREVRQTELTPVSPAWAPMIEERLECFGQAKIGGLALRFCTQDYAKAVMEEADQLLSSLPDKAGFIHCLNRCPIMYNMCMGERSTLSSGDCAFNPELCAGGRTGVPVALFESCVPVEQQCVELCLNRHWRGFFRTLGRVYW